MRRALISVSDKTGIVSLARALRELEFEVVSTGGTASLLAREGIPVLSVEEVTGMPELMDGRVKTLHPAIHAGILARRDHPQDLESLERLGTRPIDLVVVNLYPFAETSARGLTAEETIEQIDIGGPTLLRASAKNARYVTAVVDPGDYPGLVEALRRGGPDPAERQRYAAKVFAHTAYYDSVIASWMRRDMDSPFPDPLTIPLSHPTVLRYGENPHQRAAFYRDPFPASGTLSQAVQRGGKELSYNNLMDADGAWRLAQHFTSPAAVAVKHASPCGVALATTLADAFEQARDADPVSIFGGIVALNRPVDRRTAEALHALFLEVVLAPAYEDEALRILRQKRNLRVLEIPGADAPGGLGHPSPIPPIPALLRVGGGVLVQDIDPAELDETRITVATKRSPSPEEMRDLRFAWTVAAFVRSNAIVLTHDETTVGIGGGQPNRIGAAEIAIQNAGTRAAGSVLASDAFFPMPDTVEAAARAGVTAIIQPGGSLRDPESVEAADRAGIAMVLTGERHFRHS